MCGASTEKIVWDVAVDVVVLSTTAYMCAAFGAAVGSMIATPGIGTVFGTMVGLTVGFFMDYFVQNSRKYLKSWVK